MKSSLRFSAFFCCSLVLSTTGCGRSGEPETHHPEASSAPSGPATLTDRPEAHQAIRTAPPVAEQPPPPSALSGTELPEDSPAAADSGFVVGKPVEMSVPGDRPLRVLLAPEQDKRVVLYLHGMCGDPQGADVWAKQALNYGNLLALKADVPCPDRPGYKWPAEPELIEARIDRALAAFKKARGGQLDTDHILLVGYSQGAHRAELVAARSPTRYARVVLGGPPTAAAPKNFTRQQRVAILGGELENSSHMQAGQRALAGAHIASRFFLLPGSPHGSFGPKGPEVMAEVFAWLNQN